MRLGRGRVGVLAVLGRDHRQRVVAPADVDEVGVTADPHEQRQVVEGGTQPAGAGVERAARQQVDVEAEPAQQLGEATVQLEAPPAPALLDDLRVRPVDGLAHTDTMEHVQVLERHVDQMREVERGECSRGRFVRAVVGDAGQVPIDVEVGHPDHPRQLDRPGMFACASMLHLCVPELNRHGGDRHDHTDHRNHDPALDLPDRPGARPPLGRRRVPGEGPAVVQRPRAEPSHEPVPAARLPLAPRVRADRSAARRRRPPAPRIRDRDAGLRGQRRPPRQHRVRAVSSTPATCSG